MPFFSPSPRFPRRAIQRLQQAACCLLAFTLALWLSASPAWAWNSAGHLVSAAIAYRQLQQSEPQALEQVISTLKQHPDYPTRWLPQLNARPAAEQNLLLFMLAATWPDDIRGNAAYDHPTWHYINYPYQPSVPPAAGATLPAAVGGGELVTAFEQNLSVIKSTATASDKAIALCWLFHLTGDVHQPLHTTTLISEQYPEGDRGGTRFYIKVMPISRTTISLHKFWDDLILGSTRFQSVRNEATALQAKAEYQREQLPELAHTQLPDWVKESYQAAIKTAYQNGTLSSSTDNSNGAVLPANYGTAAKPVAERRMVLAGNRLADLMQQLF